MFDAVLKTGTASKSRFGAGTVLSVLVHLVLLGVVAWFSTRARQADESFPEVKFFAAPAPPPPPPPPPPAGGREPTPVEKKVEKKQRPREVLLQPREIPQEKPPEAEPVPEAPAAPEEPAGEPGGVEGGVAGGVVGGVEGGVVGGVVGGTVGGTGTDVVAFGEGMTRPSVDRQALVHNLYTREALEARISGKMIVKCQVLADGTIRNCRVIKPLPHLSEAVVRRLESMRASPAVFQGRAIAIDYVFNFDFQLPK